MNRRSFLATALTAAATAPLLGRVELVGPKHRPTLPTRQPAPEEYGRSVAEGPAIKVPSNRRRAIWRSGITDEYELSWIYLGDWDGTFRLERGCTNPAYILADLYERTGVEPDWVVAARPPMTFDGVAFGLDVSSLLKPRLDWQMLYDWGVWCDEMSDSWTAVYCGQRCLYDRTVRGPQPRLSVLPMERTPADLEHLREELRMRCLSWQARDCTEAFQRICQETIPSMRMGGVLHG